jgi:hypothetical protein
MSSPTDQISCRCWIKRKDTKRNFAMIHELCLESGCAAYVVRARRDIDLQLSDWYPGKDHKETIWYQPKPTWRADMNFSLLRTSGGLVHRVSRTLQRDSSRQTNNVPACLKLSTIPCQAFISSFETLRRLSSLSWPETVIIRQLHLKRNPKPLRS